MLLGAFNYVKSVKNGIKHFRQVRSEEEDVPEEETLSPAAEDLILAYDTRFLQLDLT